MVDHSRQMVDMCVCVYICYCLFIQAKWVVEIMKIWQLINFDCIYCQNFSMKTKFILDLLFIMITLVSLHNIHVLNYTRNIFLKKLHTKHQKTFSSSFSRSLSNTRKWENFLENTLWKMNNFPKNVNTETNRAINQSFNMLNNSLLTASTTTMATGISFTMNCI